MSVRFSAPLRRLALGALGCAALSSSVVAAASAAQRGLSVEDAWTRPAAGNAAVYFRLRNAGGSRRELVDATTPLAQSAELHQSYATTRSDDGATAPGMGMRPVASVEVPSHGSAVLRPGATHLMLIGLARDLHNGESFPLALHFRDGSTVTTRVRVRTDR